MDWLYNAIVRHQELITIMALIGFFFPFASALGAFVLDALGINTPLAERVKELETENRQLRTRVGSVEEAINDMFRTKTPAFSRPQGEVVSLVP